MLICEQTICFLTASHLPAFCQGEETQHWNTHIHHCVRQWMLLSNLRSESINFKYAQKSNQRYSSMCLEPWPSLPFVCYLFWTQIGPKGGILDGSTQSSLAFPSGMVWICAALVKVKQRPLEFLGFLSWTNRIKREALTVYLREIHQELHARPGGCDSMRPQVGAPSGFYFDPFHRTKSVHLIFRTIIKNESISCIL